MCCHVEMVLLVVQLCTGGGHEASLLVRVAMACLLVMPLVVLMEVMLDW